MRSKAGALWSALTSLVLLAGIAAPARADLVPLGPAQQIFSGPGTLFSAQVAFDDVSQVYLVVWGTFNPQPALGIFLNTSGQPITQVFPISEGQAAAGWVRVSAGGGRFMVTYTKTVGGTDRNPITHQLARFVTYQLRHAVLVGRDLPGRSRRPQQQCRLGLRARAERLPVDVVEEPGRIAAVVRAPREHRRHGRRDPDVDRRLGRSFGSRDCVRHSRHVPGDWIRAGILPRSPGRHVVPADRCRERSARGSLRYLDADNRQESQTITFSGAANRYTAAWVRTYNRVIGQGVDTGGNPLGLYSIKTGYGGKGCDSGYGQIAASLTYNAGSGTMAIGMVDWCGIAYVHELDGAGGPIAGSVSSDLRAGHARQSAHDCCQRRRRAISWPSTTTSTWRRARVCSRPTRVAADPPPPTPLRIRPRRRSICPSGRAERQLVPVGRCGERGRVVHLLSGQQREREPGLGARVLRERGWHGQDRELRRAGEKPLHGRPGSGRRPWRLRRGVSEFDSRSGHLRRAFRLLRSELRGQHAGHGHEGAQPGLVLRRGFTRRRILLQLLPAVQPDADPHQRERHVLPFRGRTDRAHVHGRAADALHRERGRHRGARWQGLQLHLHVS